MSGVYMFHLGSAGQRFDPTIRAATRFPKGAPVRVTQRVQAVARRQGVDLATVTGTGVGGRISVQDVMNASAAARAPRASQAAVTDYPTHWTEASRQASADTARRASGAGVEYPANWDTSPIDANNDRPKTNANRRAHQPSGAGVDYPSHWKR